MVADGDVNKGGSNRTSPTTTCGSRRGHRTRVAFCGSMRIRPRGRSAPRPRNGAQAHPITCGRPRQGSTGRAAGVEQRPQSCLRIVSQQGESPC
jgi:hypothetical protein